MKRHLWWVIAAVAALALAVAACAFIRADSARLRAREFFAMDTWIQIKAAGRRADALLADAQREIERLDALWSVTREDGEIYTANARGAAEISADTERIIRDAVELSARTGGAFDITIYPLVKAWGFTSSGHRVPPDEELAALLERVGADKIKLSGGAIELEPGTAVDLGAVAKGFASQRVADMLRQSGVKSAIMSLGGNVQTVGLRPDGQPWHVSISDPLTRGATIGAVRVVDAAVITSGIAERYFIQNGITYHHIIDPSTGRPADSGIASATVVAQSGVLADALSTAVFVMGAERAGQFWRESGIAFDMVLVTTSGQIFITQGLQDSFEPALGRDAAVIER